MIDKKNLVEQRVKQRNNSNKSIVNERKVSFAGVGFKSVDKLHACVICNGSKVVDGLFSKNYECVTCNGLGVDLDNPLGVIDYLLKENNRLHEELMQRNAPDTSLEDSELQHEHDARLAEAKSVEMFYSIGSKYKND